MTTFPAMFSPNGLSSSLKPFLNPFCLIRSSVSSEANTPIEGAKDRIIRDLVLSELSGRLPSGEPSDNRWGRDAEPESRLLGDEERDCDSLLGGNGVRGEPMTEDSRISELSGREEL